MEGNKFSFELLNHIVKHKEDFEKSTENMIQKTLQIRNSIGILLKDGPNMPMGRECTSTIVKLKENGNTIYNSDLPLNQELLDHNELNNLTNKFATFEQFVDSVKIFTNELELVQEHLKTDSYETDLEITSINQENVVTSSPIESIEPFNEV